MTDFERNALRDQRETKRILSFEANRVLQKCRVSQEVHHKPCLLPLRQNQPQKRVH